MKKLLLGILGLALVTGVYAGVDGGARDHLQAIKKGTRSKKYTIQKLLVLDSSRIEGPLYVEGITGSVLVITGGITADDLTATNNLNGINLILSGTSTAEHVYSSDDVEAADDLIAGDDLDVTDDGSIGGDLAVTGDFECNAVTGVLDDVFTSFDLTTASGGASNATVTIQCKNAYGANLADSKTVEFWFTTVSQSTTPDETGIDSWSFDTHGSLVANWDLGLTGGPGTNYVRIAESHTDGTIDLDITSTEQSWTNYIVVKAAGMSTNITVVYGP